MSTTRKIKIYFLLTSIAVLVFGFFTATGMNMAITGISRNIASIKYRSEAKRAGLYENASATPERSAETVPIIVYHGLLEDDAPGSKANFTAEKFQDHMFSLKKAGFESITTPELYAFLRGEGTLPPNPILITFDDGRTDSYKFADPVLRALDYKATMFAIGIYSTGKEHRGDYYVTPAELKSMARSGVWDIQAHSFDGHGTYATAPQGETGHFFGSNFWIEDEKRGETDDEFGNRITKDLREVKEGLEKLAKSPVIAFAYPFGDFGQNNPDNPSLKDITLQKTADFYNLAFYQNSPGYRFTQAYFDPDKKGSEFFSLRRINIAPEWSGEDLLRKIRQGEAKTLPYSDDFESDRGWVSQWGTVTIEPGDLHLKAGANDTGSDAVLDGSQLWKNYSVKATVSSPNRSGVYVLLRFKDDQNYNGCNFSNGFIHAEQMTEGKMNVINGKRSSSIRIPSGNFTIQARIKDRELQCSMGTISVKTEFLDPTIDKGGLGFKTWNEERGTSDIHISNLAVEEI